MTVPWRRTTAVMCGPSVDLPGRPRAGSADRAAEQPSEAVTSRSRACHSRDTMVQQRFVGCRKSSYTGGIGRIAREGLGSRAMGGTAHLRRREGETHVEHPKWSGRNGRRSPGAVRRSAGRVFGRTGVPGAPGGQPGDAVGERAGGRLGHGGDRRVLPARRRVVAQLMGDASRAGRLGELGVPHGGHRHVADADPGLLHLGGDPAGQRRAPADQSPASQEEGGALTSLSVPASNGLDATFDTYQCGGSGADGTGFVIAAEDPSTRPRRPRSATPGATSATRPGPGAVQLRTIGLGDGYLGVGLDVYGNYSNPNYDGSGAPILRGRPGSMAGQVVVRGPGDGTSGYCLLDSSATRARGRRRTWTGAEPDRSVRWCRSRSCSTPPRVP